MWWPGSSAKGEDEGDPDDSPDGASTPTSDFMEILGNRVFVTNVALSKCHNQTIKDKI